MKYCPVILAVFTAVFISQGEASPLTGFREAIRGIKISMEQYKGHVGEKENQIFANFETGLKQNATDSANEIFDEVQQKAAGHVVDKCNESLRSELDKSLKKLFPVLERCIAVNIPNWKPFEERVEAFIVQGNQLDAKIQNYENQCAGDDLCLVQKLSEVGGWFGSYQIAVGQLRTDIGVAWGKGFAEVANCIDASEKEFRNEIKEAGVHALDCMKINKII